MKFSAKPDVILDNAPIVVLVNAGSASASEIVAGALQDHKRAIIMGQKTFGKGSIQTILPMANQAALKLTTARYYTPSGRSIQASGITPDIILSRVKIESLDDDTNIVKEVNLNRHLENDKAEEDPVSTDKDQSIKENSKNSVNVSDYFLYQALNVLKGLSILNNSAK